MLDISGEWITLCNSEKPSLFEFNSLPIEGVDFRSLEFFRASFDTSSWNDWENPSIAAKKRSFVRVKDAYFVNGKILFFEGKRIIPSRHSQIFTLSPAPGSSGTRYLVAQRFFWDRYWFNKYSIPENPNLFFPLSMSIEVLNSLEANTIG